jgi:phosphatidate cytidylyltransferase
MQFLEDPIVARVLIGLGLVLIAATAIGRTLGGRARTPARRVAMQHLNARIDAWWVMCGVVLVSLATGSSGVMLMFALLSFLALREFITLTPTNRADHRVLLVVFFALIPLQYAVVGLGWYESFSLMIPVAGALGLSVTTAVIGVTEGFGERVARVQWGLILCVYALSHVPAVLMLQIPGYAGQNSKLLMFLIIVVESSDVLQYVWGKLCGRRAIAPVVSPNKTLEGLLGGVTSATLVGAALFRLTPFRPLQAAALALAAAVAGFGGGLVMSATKRDCGVKDFGSAIAGHGGILDRVDSLCFAGPVFFHITRYFFAI